jgi:hypothetical protein
MYVCVYACMYLCMYVCKRPSYNSLNKVLSFRYILISTNLNKDSLYPNQN